jgi:hypothetical protein
MSKLGQVIEAVTKHSQFVLDQVKRARSDEKFARELTERWNKIKVETPITRVPTGLPLPSLALPETASLEKSAKAAWRWTQLRTWCGFTMVSNSARPTSPPR